jgi:adenosylmethionine-8-amino-7-oxononanoate aminotransferase
MPSPHPYAVHRRWDRDYHIIQRTEGIYLYDTEGNRYIDATGGSSVVVTVGHGVKDIPDAMYEQAQDFSFYPAHAFSNRKFRELSELIVRTAPGEMKDNAKVWITCTGTDATDDAVRLARQHWVEKGMMAKHLVVARWQAFHGNNISVAGLSGITGRRSIFQPMFIDMPHIPPAFCYRCPFELDYPACELKCARALESMIRQVGPENVAAFIAEPVVGAALGAVPAPEGYFQKVREICDKYDVLLIIDEVMTGFGRTGTMWGIEHWDGVTPDIIGTAKGITSGYTTLAAVIARNEIWQPLIDNNSPYKAGHTLNANAVSCAGAIATLEYLREHNLVMRSAEMGAYMLSEMEDKLLKHSIVGDVRGKGLMVGFELVKDKATKEPFDPRLLVANRLEDIAFDRGLITYPCTGAVDGQAGDMTLLAPPLIITREQVDDVVHILDESLTALEEDLL